MTRREKTGIVLVVTGFLLVLFGCCMVVDNIYWWEAVESNFFHRLNNTVSPDILRRTITIQIIKRDRKCHR